MIWTKTDEATASSASIVATAMDLPTFAMCYAPFSIPFTLNLLSLTYIYMCVLLLYVMLPESSWLYVYVYICTEIPEVNISAFAYRLCHEDWREIFVKQSVGKCK